MDQSLVIPVYNEEESIQELTDWIVRVCSARIISFDIIFVEKLLFSIHSYQFII